MKQKEAFVVEYCGNCENENEFRWDVKAEGYKAYCLHCGAVLMLCDECIHSDDPPIQCCPPGTLPGECTRCRTNDTGNTP